MSFRRINDELWLNPVTNLLLELRQSQDEGRKIPSELCQKIKELDPNSDEHQAEAIKLFQEIAKIPADAALAAKEPDDLDSIHALCSQVSPLSFSGNLEEHIAGGWLGRSAGCLLGQPVEAWKRSRIQGFLKDTGNYPIQNYFSSDVSEELRQRWDITDGPGPYDAEYKSWVNLIDCMKEDDDLNYTIFSLKVLERVGRDFTSEDVAYGWLISLPFLLTCSAERVAYRNISNLILPPQSASFCNPYREWIGAQIRTDLYGWVNPCNPKAAAEMAWKDGRISHTRNGLYGAMFAAAMCAAAFGEITLKEVIQQGLGQIPAQSRLAQAVEQVITWYEEGVGEEEAICLVHSKWNEDDPFDWCHVIPNAMLVAIALLWGNKDFTRTIGIAVEAGFDTDCNAATAGSVLGIMIGGQAIPEKWTLPLHNKIQSGVHGYPEISISELTARTAAQVVK